MSPTTYALSRLSALATDADTPHCSEYLGPPIEHQVADFVRRPIIRSRRFVSIVFNPDFEIPKVLAISGAAPLRSIDLVDPNVTSDGFLRQDGRAREHKILLGVPTNRPYSRDRPPSCWTVDTCGSLTLQAVPARRTCCSKPPVRSGVNEQSPPTCTRVGLGKRRTRVA